MEAKSYKEKKANILKALGNNFFELIEKYSLCFFVIELIYIVLNKQANIYIVLLISFLVPFIEICLLIKYVIKYNFILLNGKKKIAKIEKVNIRTSWNPRMINPKVEVICVMQIDSSKLYLKYSCKTKSNIFSYSDTIQVYYINPNKFIIDFKSANIPDIYH